MWKNSVLSCDFLHRSFDFEVETKSGVVHTFSSIEKDEYGKLFDFITSKKLRVKNRGKSVSQIRNSSWLMHASPRSFLMDQTSILAETNTLVLKLNLKLKNKQESSLFPIVVKA
jgi:hypothetical protein